MSENQRKNIFEFMFNRALSTLYRWRWRKFQGKGLMKYFPILVTSVCSMWPSGNDTAWRAEDPEFESRRTCFLFSSFFLFLFECKVLMSQMSHESTSQWVRSEKIKVSVETIILSITFTDFVYYLHCCLHKAYFWHEISPGCLLAVPRPCRIAEAKNKPA